MIFGSASLTNEPADERRGEVVEPAGVVDRLEHRPALRASDRQVLGAERRRHVHDAGARRPSRRSRPRRRVCAPSTFGVRRPVADPDQVGSRHASRRPSPLRHRARVRASASPSDQPLAVPFHHHVGRVGVDGEALVRRERPRRRRPDQERCADEDVGREASRTREPHEHARVLDRPVAHRDLGVRERGPAPGAVRGDLVGLDQQPALVQLLERPPHRLDVLGVHRPVGVGHVDPEADPLGEPFELVDVARRPTRGTAG